MKYFFLTILTTWQVGEVTNSERDWETRRRLKEEHEGLHLGHIKMNELVVKLAAKDAHYNLFTYQLFVCARTCGHASVKGILLVS